MKRLSRRRPEEKVVDFQAKVDQLVRLDRAEDQLLGQAAREAHEAEVHAVRALEAIAAAKRVDALEDQVIAELRQDSHDVAGDITALTTELFDVTRVRVAHPLEAGEATS